jgi:hypothetical protein
MPAEVTISPRKVQLTTRSGVEISRLIPHQQLRAIGAWVFLDYYGPTDQREAMSVGAHPHVGLQTVSWLFSGEIEHRDSLQSTQLVNPGELNLMTAGAGIAHSELSLDSTAELHGVQLWTVLPESARAKAPRFDHYSNLPHFRHGAMAIKLFMGDLLGHSSPATRYSELLGAEISIDPHSITDFPCLPDFEYGFLLIGGDLTVNDVGIAEGQLHYLPTGTASCEISSRGGARIILLGGAPFTEKIIMWWNFIGRTHEEIVAMRNDWNSPAPSIPTFSDQINLRIPAPELPALQLTPRSLQR